MHGGDRYNGTRRGDQRDNRSHRSNQEIRQRNTRSQSHNYRHSVPVSTQYPVDYRQFLNIYPSSAHSFMLPNMSVPPPPHPPPSNMWCPQWSQTESRDYRSFSIYSGQQQLCTTGHASAIREEVSRRQESIPGNLFNMPPPPVSSRVPMPMSELYPPCPDMQSSTSGTQAPSSQTQVSSSRTQTSSVLQSSTSGMQTSTSGLHASTSELHTPISEMHASTSSLHPSTSGTQSSHSRRGPSLVPESHRTTSEYVSHTLIHRVTSGVPPSASGLQSQSYPGVSETQQAMFQSPTSGDQTLTKRRNSASPEIKSLGSQSTMSGSDVTPYTTQQSTSATQSKSFYSENIFEPHSRHISSRRPSVSKTHPLGSQLCSENICESQPCTSDCISDRQSSASETQSQTETDRSACFSWLESSLYVRPPRVIPNDINEPEEVPVSRFFEFVNCVKKSVFPHLFFDNSNEARFVDALNLFLKLLSDVRSSIRVPDYLLNFLMRIVHVASHYYRRISCSQEDEYLEIMEDVFVHYSEVVLALFEIWDLTEETEKPGSFIGKITRMLLTRSMLLRIDNILNCLIKIETHPSLHFHCRFLIDLYWVFLRYLNFKYTDENLIRMFVVWRKFELLCPDDVVKLRECRENQLRHGRRHVVLESIPLLNEMIEVSKRDPRYSVRDVIAIYWWWWEITKDELRNKSEKEKVNIIRFPKMCNSRYLANKTSAKPPQFASNMIAVKRERGELFLTKMAKHIKRPARIDSTVFWDLRTPIISSLQESNASIITDCQWVFEPSILDTIEIHDSYSAENEQAISVPLESHAAAFGRSRNESGRHVELEKARKSINTSHIQDIKMLGTIGESRTSVETTMIKHQKVVGGYAELSNVRLVSKHAPYGPSKRPNNPTDQNLNILSPVDDSGVSITECQEPIRREYNSEVRQVSTSAFEKASRSIGIQSDQDVIKFNPVADIRSDVVKASGKKREVTEEFIEVSNDSQQLQVDKSDSNRKSSSTQSEIQKKLDTLQYNPNDIVRDKICNGPMQVSKDAGDHHVNDFLLKSTQRSIGSPSEKNLEVFFPARSSCIGDSQNVPVQTTSVGRVPEQGDQVFTLANILEDEKVRILTDDVAQNSPEKYDIPGKLEQAESRSQKTFAKRRIVYVPEEEEHQIDRRSLENKEIIHSDTLKKGKPSLLSDNHEERRYTDFHDISVTLEVVRPEKKFVIHGSNDVSEGKRLNNKQEKTKLSGKQSGESELAPGTSKNSQVEKCTIEAFERRHQDQRICGVELHGVTMDDSKGVNEKIFEETNSVDLFEETEQVYVVENRSLPKYEQSKKPANKPENDKDSASGESQEKWSPEVHKSSQDRYCRKSEQMFQELNSVNVLEKEENRHIRENSKSALDKTGNIHGVETEEVIGTLFEKKEEKHSQSKLYNIAEGLTVLEKARASNDKSEQDNPIETRERKSSEKLYNVFEELGEDNCKKTSAVSEELSSKDVPEESDHTTEKMVFPYSQPPGIGSGNSHENEHFLDNSEKRYDDKLKKSYLLGIPQKIESCYSEQSEKTSENRFSGVTEEQVDTKLRTAKLSYKQLEVGRSMPGSPERQLVLGSTEKRNEEVSKGDTSCVQAELYDAKNEELAHQKDKSSPCKSEEMNRILSLQKSMELDVAKLHVTTKERTETQFDNNREVSREQSTNEMLEENHSQTKKVILRIEETFRDISVVPDTSNTQQADNPKRVEVKFGPKQMKEKSQLQLKYGEDEAIFEERRLTDVSEYPSEAGASSTQDPNDGDGVKNNSPDISPLTTEGILDVSQKSNQERHCDKAGTWLLATTKKSKGEGLGVTDECIAIFKNLKKSNSIGETNRPEEEKVFFKVIKVFNGTGHIESLQDEDNPEDEQSRRKEIQDIGQLGEVILNTVKAERKKLLGTNVLISVKVQSKEKKIGEDNPSESIDLYLENLSPGEDQYLGQEGQLAVHNVPGDDVMDKNDGAFYLSDSNRVFLSVDGGTPETTLGQFRDSLEFCMNKTLQLPEKCSSSMKISSFNNGIGFTKPLYQQVDSQIDLHTENEILIGVEKKDAASRQRQEDSPNSKDALVIRKEDLDQLTTVLPHSRGYLDSLDTDNRSFGAVNDTRSTVVNLDEGSSKKNNIVTSDRFVTATTEEEIDNLEKIQQCSVLEVDQLKPGELNKNVHESVMDVHSNVESSEKIVFEESVMKSSEPEQNQVPRSTGECKLNQCHGCNLQSESSATFSDGIEKNIDNTYSTEMLEIEERSSVTPMKCQNTNLMSSEVGDDKKKDRKVAAPKSSSECSKPEIAQNSNFSVEKPDILIKGDLKDQLKIDKSAGLAEDSMNDQNTPLSKKAPVVLDASVAISNQTEPAICKGYVAISKESRNRLIEETKCHSDSNVASGGSGTRESLADIPKEEKHDRPSSETTIVPGILDTVKENILVMSGECQGNKREKNTGKRKRRKNGYDQETRSVSPQHYQEHVKKMRGNKTDIGETSVASDTTFEVSRSAPGITASSNELESGININEIVETPKSPKNNSYRDNILQITQETFPSFKKLQPEMDTMRCPQTNSNDDQQLKKDSLAVRMDITVQQISSIRTADVASTDDEVPSGQELMPSVNDNNIISIDVLDKCAEKKGSRLENLESTVNRIPPSVFSLSAESHSDKFLIKDNVHSFISEIESWWPKTSGEGTLPSEVLSDLFEESQDCLEDRGVTGPENSSYETLVRNEVQQFVQETQNQLSKSSLVSSESESQVLPPTSDMDPSALKPISQPNTLASFYSTFVKEVSETDILSPPVPDDAPLEANVIIPISESQSGALMSFDSQHANVTTPQNKIMIGEKETTTEGKPLSDSQSYSLQSTATKRILDNVLSDQGVDSDLIPHNFTQDNISHNVEPSIEPDVQLQAAAKQTSSILKKHVDKVPKVDNDLHGWSSESTVTGPKKHSVTFFEEKTREIYNREYGNQMEMKNSQNYQIRTTRRMSKAPYSKDDSEGVRLKRKKRQKEIFKKPEIIDKSISRPHITAEDNDLFQNAIEGPVGKPMRSTGDTAPMVLWDDKDELCQPGSITVKSDSQLRKVKNENLVSVLKKPKNKDKHTEGREYKGYKLPPSVDPKILKEIVIRLTDNGIISNSLIQCRSNKRLRQHEVGAGERAKRQLVVQAEHEKVLERARMMELKEQQLKQETGILYCIFSDKWSWTEKHNSSKNNSSKPVTRKVRFEGESDDNHNHGNHRKGQKLPEKRKRNYHPDEEVAPKQLKISIRTDLIEKRPKKPTTEEKDVSDNGITDLQGRSRPSEKTLVGKQISDVKNGPPKLQTRSGRLRKKPSGKDYYDLTESTGRRKSST